ncbi:MAG TPA: site-specific integrase [Solirubrobacteraceae bacterium]|nr:site-specific integrase [Solirubrobacteraceae bacterium]
MLSALADFVIFCRVERRLSGPTCKAYERDVRACLQHLRAAGISALSDVRTPGLRRFLAAEAVHRPAPSSQARRVAALRCFFRLCVESWHIEPLFGHTKFNRRIDRFQRRGRSAVQPEWRLITATHNLLKLHSHQIAAAGA